MKLSDIERRVSLAGYTPAPLPVPGGFAAVHPNGLAVILTFEEHGGKEWVHLSTSRKDRIPSWEDIVFVRDTVLGRDAKVIQVIPPASQYVNVHPNCMHLWHCVTEDPLPDFRNAMGLL